MTDQVQFEEDNFDQTNGLRIVNLQQELMSRKKTPFLIKMMLRFRIARTQEQAIKILLYSSAVLILVALYCMKLALTHPTIHYLKLK